MQIKKSHARIPSWAQTLNPLYAVAAACVFFFFLKGAFHASDWRADPSSLPPSSSSQHCSPPPPPPPSLPPSLSVCCHGDSHMGMLFLFVFQVQTLYYSPDHKLVDGGLLIEAHNEVFGGEEDHLQFVQVLNSLCRLHWNEVSTTFCLAVCCCTVQRVPGHA